VGVELRPALVRVRIGGRWSERGGLTPPDTGSSAKALPNPHQGYDRQDEPTTELHQTIGDQPKNCLATREDSICTRDDQCKERLAEA